MATYYAWTEIKGSNIVIPRGDKVTAAKLEIKEVEFQAMIDAGAIRTKQYPVPDGYQGSAIDYMRDQLREATSVADDLGEVEAQVDVSILESVSG